MEMVLVVDLVVDQVEMELGAECEAQEVDILEVLVNQVVVNLPVVVEDPSIAELTYLTP